MITTEKTGLILFRLPRRIRDADVQAALARWAQPAWRAPWQPTLTITRCGLLFRGSWSGPMGGRYHTYALTRRGVYRGLRYELARWTRKKRKIAKRRVVRERARVSA